MINTRNTTRIIKKARIFNALIWATVIILNSFVLKGSAEYYSMFCILIAGAAIQVSLSDSLSKKIISEKYRSEQKTMQIFTEQSNL